MADISNNQQKEANFHFYLNTQGPRGQKGREGEPGFSPTITVSENTLNTYKLKVTTVDGEFETENLRGSIITDGEGSYIKYDAATDKLYVGDVEAASPEVYGIVRTATEEDLANLSESAVTTVSDVADFISTHLQAGDDSISLSYDEDTGIITVTAKGGGAGGVSDYNDLTNKPSINGVLLKGGNNTLEELGIAGVFDTISPLEIKADSSMDIKGYTIDNNTGIISGGEIELPYGDSDVLLPNFLIDTASSDIDNNKLKFNYYIDFPFKIGDIYATRQTNVNLILGKKNGDLFTPLIVNGTILGNTIENREDGVLYSGCTNPTIFGGAVESNTLRDFIIFNQYSENEVRIDYNNASAGSSAVLGGNSPVFTGDNLDILKSCDTVRVIIALNNIVYTKTQLSSKLNFAKLKLNTIGRIPTSEEIDNSEIDGIEQGDKVVFNYDNDVFGINTNGELTISKVFTTKAEFDDLSEKVTSINTEVDSLDSRVTALEDGGSSGGTTDYEQLTNLPSINSVQLKGDNSADTLDLEYAFTAVAPLQKTKNMLNQVKQYNIDRTTGVITSYPLFSAPSWGTTFQCNLNNWIDTSTSLPDQNKFDFKYYIDYPFKTGLYLANPSSYTGIFIGTKDDTGLFTPRVAITTRSSSHKVAIVNGLVTGSDTVLSITEVTASSIGGGSNGTHKCFKIATEEDGSISIITLLTNSDSSSRGLWKSSQLSNELLQCNTIRFLPANSTNLAISGSAIQPVGEVDNPEYAGDWPTTAERENFKMVMPARSVVVRNLSLDIDNDTIKVNEDGKLYTPIVGLPSDISTSVTDSTVTISSSKAIEFDIPTMYTPENLVHKDGSVNKLYLHQGSIEAGTNVTIDETATGVRINSSASGGGGEDKYGIQADYSTRHGILDCPNGLIDFSSTNKQIILNQGVVLNCAGNGSTKTTIATAINKTLETSEGDITLFYAGGELLECGKVDYSTTEPTDNGVDNYQAWFNPDKTTNPDQQWQFKSNDTGNVFRAVESATPIADIRLTTTGVTSVSYIGYRILDDGIIAQLSDIENLHDTVQTVQEDVTEVQTALGGFKLVKLTQAEYDALATKDENTLYVITDQEAFVTAAEAAHAGGPASSAQELQLGATGTAYTAPGDGYINVNITTGTNGGRIRILSGTLSALGYAPANKDVCTSTRVSKGDIFNIYYDEKITSQTEYLRFVPCIGYTEE